MRWSYRRTQPPRHHHPASSFTASRHTPAGPSRNITKAIGSWELPHGLDAGDAAETIWTGILGCHLLSAARGDEPYDRLARNWGVLLTALAPKSELPALNDSLTDMPGRYQVAA